MRNQPETVHEFNIARLNWIFAALAIGFLGTILWMIYDDWWVKKPWKEYQLKFQEIEARKLAEDAKLFQARADALGLEKINAELKAIVLQESAVTEAWEGFDKARVAHELADRAFKFEKSTLDNKKYLYTDAFERVKHEHESWTPEKIREEPAVYSAARELDAVERAVRSLELVAQKAELAKKEAEEKYKAIVGKRDGLLKDRERLLSEKKIIESRRELLEDKAVRYGFNAPIIDFLQPTLTFNQKVIDTYRISVNFADIPRVDRCTTCHVGIDKRGGYPTIALKEKRKPPFASELLEELIASGRLQGYLTHDDIAKWAATLDYGDSPKGLAQDEWNLLSAALRDARVDVKDYYATLKDGQPYLNHPRLDLFVSNDSPHPIDKFGCSSCHWGRDRETEFIRAAHSPDDHTVRSFELNGKKVQMTQKEYWQHTRHWKPAKYFDQPMYQARFTEASCAKCHTNVTDVPLADKLNYGRALIETSGCYGCHAIPQLETKVAYKIDSSQGIDPSLALDPKLPLDRKRALMDESIAKLAQTYHVQPGDIRSNNLLNKPSDLLAGRSINIPFRTLGKRGPSLERVSAKTTPEWTRQWLANPRNFRPNTWMPHFWGLVNNKDLDRSDYVTGPTRDALEINALTEYLFAISEKPAYPAPPAGDPAKGKQWVNNLGCLACHMIGETYEGLRASKLAKLKTAQKTTAEIKAEMTRFERELLMRSQGPSLDGSGAKLRDAGWTYAWLKNPKQFSPNTSMPNLRLSDQEAADITAYLLTLTAPAAPPVAKFSEESLDKLTVEYLENTMPNSLAKEVVKTMRTREGKSLAAEAHGVAFSEAEIAIALREKLKNAPEEFEDIMRDDAKKRTAFEKTRLELGAAKLGNADLTAQKNLFIGRQMVDRYGCFGCHEIKGFEKGKPIGPELNEWGSKSVLKLDFGYLPPHEVPRTNIAFLHQKISEPRTLDTVDTKKPQEFLRMPQFRFHEEKDEAVREMQLEAIMTHVFSQTAEKISPAGLRKLNATDQDIENGRWLVKELNCVGCHVFEGKGEAKDPAHYGKGGAIRMTIDDPTYWPPILYNEGAKVQPQWLFKFLQKPFELRPAFFESGQHARMPNYNLSDEQINILIRYFNAVDNQSFPFETGTVQFHAAPASATAGEATFKAYQCVLCHNIVPGNPVDAAQLQKSGPDLVMTKHRLKPLWVLNWLTDPNAIQPGTRMPKFPFENDAQLRSLRDYLWTYPGLKPDEIAKPAPAKPVESFE